ncbi:MAG: hypothetical protein JW995_15125 [Melioribacteraceae bacterium]|nr:hypothetical protein [Melioribacteraceae bacterium]
MKRIINFSVIFAALLLFSSTAFAQTTVGTGLGSNGQGLNWVDADGDGICDNFGTANQGSSNGAKGAKKMNRMNGQGGQGLAKGFGNGTGLRPQDGTGLGAGKGSGSGVCDGSGPKGAGRRGNSK